MKGWQNQYIVTQRVNRNDGQVQDIKYFENNNYLQTLEINDHLLYIFPQSECFSLSQLIESMKCNFIKIYKGQVLIIILEVLKHLQQLHQKNISHGRLKPQNIVIKLKKDKDNKLTIQQIKFTIEQVYFINYRIIDDIQYEINTLQDIHDIIDCCIQFISAYKTQLCELFKFIVDNLNYYKSNQKETKDINKLVDFFSLQIKECVDQQLQKIKEIKIYPSQLIEESIKVIHCKEGEEYNYLSKRYRGQTTLANFLEKISAQPVNYELKFYNNNPEYCIDGQVVLLFDTFNLNQEELLIFNVFEQIIKQQMMKIIWNTFGEFLESWYQEIYLKYDEIIKIMNQRNKEILNNHLNHLLYEFKNIKQINEEIQNKIEQDYKFKFNYDEQKAKDQFILELKIQAINYDFNTFQVFINNVKSQVKQDLQEYYNQMLEYEIFNLDFELI